jgi:hypothetical protein
MGRIESEVYRLCPKAWFVNNMAELEKALERCYANGDTGIEPMFGQGNVWWLMSNRM